jgi:hypothetical protein
MWDKPTVESHQDQLNSSVEEIGSQVIETRDAVGDVGAKFDEVYGHRNLASIIRQNAKRAQEGIRVLEELSKLPDHGRLYYPRSY